MLVKGAIGVQINLGFYSWDLPGGSLISLRVSLECVSGFYIDIPPINSCQLSTHLSSLDGFASKLPPHMYWDKKVIKPERQSLKRLRKCDLGSFYIMVCVASPT